MSNLGLQTINNSDFVSPDPINANFNKVDALGKDYIVDSGYSGEWWYKKFKSGRAECGIDDKSFGDLDHWDQHGNTYRSGWVTFGNYPFPFLSRPTAIITQNSSDTGTGAWVWYSSEKTATKSPTFASVDFERTDNKNAHFSIFVTGRWR